MLTTWIFTEHFPCKQKKNHLFIQEGDILYIMSAIFSSAIHDVDWNHLEIAKLNSIEIGECLRIGCTAEFKS